MTPRAYSDFVIRDTKERMYFGRATEAESWEEARKWERASPDRAPFIVHIRTITERPLKPKP